MFTHQLYNDKDRAYQGNVEVYPILHQLEPSHGSSISIKRILDDYDIYSDTSKKITKKELIFKTISIL